MCTQQEKRAVRAGVAGQLPPRERSEGPGNGARVREVVGATGGALYNGLIPPGGVAGQRLSGRSRLVERMGTP